MCVPNSMPLNSARKDVGLVNLGIGDVASRQFAGDEPGIAVLAGQVCQQHAGVKPERYDPSSSRVVG